MASTRAQPTDEAALAELRQANAQHARDYERHLAAIERYQSRTISASALRVAVLGILKSPP
jgi:ferric-dicitrate binding protein FerR (iron transport regulator)